VLCSLLLIHCFSALPHRFVAFMFRYENMCNNKVKVFVLHVALGRTKSQPQIYHISSKNFSHFTCPLRCFFWESTMCMMVCYTLDLVYVISCSAHVVANVCTTDLVWSNWWDAWFTYQYVHQCAQSDSKAHHILSQVNNNKHNHNEVRQTWKYHSSSHTHESCIHLSYAHKYDHVCVCVHAVQQSRWLRQHCLR
jgi:hypothetical protein